MAKGYAYMKNKHKIAVLGGDLRQYAVAKEFSKTGVGVYTYGLNADVSDIPAINECDNASEAICLADVVILPLPASTDGNLLNCPALKSNERIALDTVIEHMNEKTLLFGGRIPQNTVVKAQGKGIKVYDYFLSEKLQIKNAYITAEAALSIAMNSLDRCIRGARFAITGTGRISRLLADLLVRLGGNVCVAGRNADSLVYFEILGCKTVVIEEMPAEKKWYDEFLDSYDLIFNTVPAWLFDRSFLERANKKMIIIELASAPGGVDICAARELSSNMLWASSLPGKYAPYSAGRLIAEYILEILEREVGMA